MLSVEEIKKIPMFFIVGSPRSGTTMLQQMLDANPNLILPLESPWIIVLKKRYFNLKLWTTDLLLEFINELYKERKFNELWKVDRELLTKEILQLPLNSIDFATLIRVVYINYPSFYKKNNITLIGDKNPVYAIYIDELFEIFPEAKFIHLVRDYRPNILSNRKWFLKQRISVLAYQWFFYNWFIEKHKLTHKKHYYTIRYEDLVSEPEKYTKEITNFLNFEFTNLMLQTHQILQTVYTNESSNIKHVNSLKGLHEHLKEPISAERLNKWENEMKPYELELADYIDGDFAKKYGYKKVYNTKGFKLFCQKLFGLVAIRSEVFIVRFYHKRIGKNLRKLLRISSILMYNLFGFTHLFNPELSDELKKKIKK